MDNNQIEKAILDLRRKLKGLCCCIVKCLQGLPDYDSTQVQVLTNNTGDIIWAAGGGGGTPSGPPTEVTYFDVNTGLLTSDSNFVRRSNDNFRTLIIATDGTKDGTLDLQNSSISLLSNSGLGTSSGIVGSQGALLQIFNGTTPWLWPTVDGGLGDVLTTDGSGNLTFAPVVPTLTQNQIAFGDGSNLMTSSPNVLTDGSTFFIVVTGASGFSSSIGGTSIGDISNNVNSTTIVVDDITQIYTLNKLGGGGTQLITTDNSGTLGTTPLGIDQVVVIPLVGTLTFTKGILTNFV